MAHVLPPAKDPLVGRTIGGKYELESFIRGDDLGRVYLAKHNELRRAVSVRVLHGSHLEDRELAERFHRGGLAAARVRHRNVVEVIDFGQEQDGSLYMVSEHIAGRNLRQLVAAERALPPDRVTHITMQIAAGMAAAHKAGIVHRDVKPENILVFTEHTDDGDIAEVVKILNFGVAKIEEPLNQRKTLEMVQGDPHFMSPEQCNGQTLDKRADLYSTGCLAYFLATGQPPFDGSTLDLLVKHVKDAPVPPSKLNSDVPTSLDNVILRALAKQPEKRWGTGLELRAALKALNIQPPTPSSQIQIDVIPDVDEDGETSPALALPPTEQQDTPVRKAKPGVIELNAPPLPSPASPTPKRESKPQRPPPGRQVERFRDTLVMDREKELAAIRASRKRPMTLLVVAVLAAIFVGIAGGLLAGRAISDDSGEDQPTPASP